MRPKIAAFGLLVATLLVGCASQEPAKRTALPFGVVDTPKPNEPVGNGQWMTGWALGDEDLEGVDVYLDRQHWGRAAVGKPRPDLAPIYPQNPLAGTAGFAFAMPTAGVNPGPHEIVIQARTKSGATRDLASMIVQIKP